MELVQGGADIDVTDENKFDFVTARFKYTMMERISMPLAALLRGFYEVVFFALGTSSFHSHLLGPR